MKIDVPEWLIWNNSQFTDVKAINIFDHKDGECIGYVCDDDGNVHFAIQLDEAVIAVEHTPANYPATSLAFYVDRAHWIKAVEDCDWLVAGLRAERNLCGPDCPEELLEEGAE
jgi:hypothetical protein